MNKIKFPVKNRKKTEVFMNSKNGESEFQTLAQLDARRKTGEAGTVIPTKRGVDDAKRFSEENEK